MGGIIYNPDNVEITKKEIYSSIWEFSIPEEYQFECNGTSYGNHIYGRVELDNFYVIKKRNNESASI